MRVSPPIVMLNLFQHKALSSLVILKRVQDDEAYGRHDGLFGEVTV